jgi:chemotaxis protein MotB
MAKPAVENEASGVIVKPSKGGKPPKVRRFPWRLWLYALVMTAAAGAGGYFAWHYRGEATTATDANGACQTSLKTASDDAKKQGDDAAQCKASLAGLTTEATKVKAERDQLAKGLAGSKDELASVRTAKEQAEARAKSFDDIMKQFTKMIGTGELKIVSRRGSLVLSLPAEVLFPSGVAELSEDGKLKVLEVAFNLKKFPDRRFMVLGHTDNQPPQKNGTYRDNWELSTARAINVTRVLAQGGMTKKNLIAAGAGEFDELVPNASAGAMQRNRRIEIILLPALDELPPLPASLDAKDEAKDKDAKGGGKGAK